jgi:hypothetical protein
MQRVMLARDPGDAIDDDQALLTSWAYTLETWAALTEADSIARLLHDYASILDLSLNPADLAWLGEIAAKAERLLEVGDRYLEGKLSPGA